MADAKGEWIDRADREYEKAREKYGEEALVPGGHPDYDILDYVINEVVGLYRYGEMLMERGKTYPPEFLARAQTCGAIMRRWSQTFGEELIQLRQALERAGVNLGKGEQ